MFLLDDILLAPLKGILFIGEKIEDIVKKEDADEGKIKERLMNLQAKLEMGEVSEEEYDEQEKELLDKIEKIRACRENEQA